MQYCKAIIFQLKINLKKNWTKDMNRLFTRNMNNNNKEKKKNQQKYIQFYSERNAN